MLPGLLARFKLEDKYSGRAFGNPDEIGKSIKPELVLL